MKLRESLRNAASAGRIWTPDDVARLIVFLGSEDGRRTTGQVIRSRGVQ
jgi:NAD(P)-dependent dehydrogenase (short-subunit alcohol dehydrogenase family)